MIVENKNVTFLTAEDLRELCTLTAELTKIRQAECKHLCVENFAPDLLSSLIRAYLHWEHDFRPAANQ